MKYYIQISTPYEIVENVYEVLRKVVKSEKGYVFRVTETTIGHKYKNTGPKGRLLYLLNVERFNRRYCGKINDEIRVKEFTFAVYPHYNSKISYKNFPKKGDWVVCECHNYSRYDITSPQFKGQLRLCDRLKALYFTSDLDEAIQFLRNRMNQFPNSKWANEHGSTPNALLMK